RPDHRTAAIDQLLASTPRAMVVMDADGRVVRVNTRAEKLLGYSQEELVGQKTDMLIPHSRRGRKPKHGAARVTHKVRPFVYGLETVVRRRDGWEFPALVNLGYLEAGGDTLISSEIQEIQRDQRNDLDLHALVEASDDAIIGTDLDGIIVSWNKGAEKICGYKAEEI